MVVLAGGAVSYEQGTPLGGRSALHWLWPLSLFPRLCPVYFSLVSPLSLALFLSLSRSLSLSLFRSLSLCLCLCLRPASYSLSRKAILNIIQTFQAESVPNRFRV